MSVFSFEKQPWEEFSFQVDYARAFSTSETVSTGYITAVDPGGADVTATLLSGAAYSGQLVTVAVKGGNSGIKYKYTVRAVGSLGTKIEDQVYMTVLER